MARLAVGKKAPTDRGSAAQTIRTGSFPLRISNLFTMLRDRDFYPTINAPVFRQHGGSVPKGHSLNNNASAGTVSYPLDGSDPRLAGGNVSPAALTTVATSSTFILSGCSWHLRYTGSQPAANGFPPPVTIALGRPATRHSTAATPVKPRTSV